MTTATTPGAVRVRYRERQVLRAVDLEVEQSYLIAARRRHNIGHHGWGVVRGLEIQDTPELLVQPGMAVDGYGRELIVPAPVKIPDGVFDELADTALDVWLFYDLVEVNVPQRGSWVCGPGKNPRTREQASLRLTAASGTEQRLPIEVPREPVEVASDDLPFLPHRTPPDDPAREWPIYLGTIKQNAAVVFDPNSPRPYATLVGEVVTAPSGRARMQVGAELESDTRRFAVGVADAAGKFIERVAIDRDGDTFITGNTTITNRAGEPAASRLRMLKNKPPASSEPPRSTEPLCTRPAGTGPQETPGAAHMVHFRPLAATPEVAAPWQIYRTSIKQDKQTIQQLRVEIGHPGDKGDPKLSKLTIGTRNADGVFVPCFTLSADCTVTIEGDVKVMGQFVEGPIRADVSDTRFSAVLAKQWVDGTKAGETAATSGTIQGTVMRTDRTVIPAANVELKNLDAAFTTNVGTNEAGRFIAAVIPMGRYSIKATAAGFNPKIIESQLAAAETLEITVTMETIPPTGTIQGTLTDTNGAVIPGGTVEIRHLDAGFTRSTTTNAEGQFVFPAIPAGTYRIRATALGFNPEVIEPVEPGETVDITLTPEAPSG